MPTIDMQFPLSYYESGQQAGLMNFQIPRGLDVGRGQLVGLSESCLHVWCTMCFIDYPNSKILVDPPAAFIAEPDWKAIIRVVLRAHMVPIITVIHLRS